MNTPVENFLARVEGVRQMRADQWSACCPAHSDRHPSLLISVGDDGRVLLYCYASCSGAEIVAAVGMSLADLFVQRLTEDEGRRHRRRRPTVSAKDAINVLEHERLVVMAIVNDIQRGHTPTPDDLARLADAGRKIERLREIVS